MLTPSKNNRETKKLAGIPESRVANLDFLHTLGEIYKCNICFNIMINPSDCEVCGHSYCLDCISCFSCPYNCESVKPKASSMAIRILLNQITFSCSNEGCSKILNYNNILLHDQECDLMSTKCPSPNCGITLSKKSLEKHMKEECKFVYEKCKFCLNDLLRYDLIEHQENCEAVYNSLNDAGDNNLLSDKRDKLSSHKYIEALNYNIVKIIRDHETKYKNLEEENKKIKIEINTGVNNVWQSLKDDLKLNALTLKEQSKSTSNLFDESRLKQTISDVLKVDLNEVILSNIKELFNSNQQILKSCIEKSIGFDSLPNQFSSEGQSIDYDKLNEDVLNIVKRSLAITEENVTKVIEKRTDSVLEELNLLKHLESKINMLQITVMKKNTSSEFTSFILDNASKNKKESLIIDTKRVLTEKLEEINSKMNQLTERVDKQNHLRVEQLQEENQSRHNSAVKSEETDKKLELNAKELSYNLIKNVLEAVENNNKDFKNIIDAEVKNVNERIENKYDILCEEVQNIKNELKTICKNTKNLSKVIIEEISDVVSMINSNTANNENKNKAVEEIAVNHEEVMIKEVSSHECSCGKLVRIEEILNELLTTKSHDQSENINDKNNSEQAKEPAITSMSKIFEDQFDTKLKDLESHLITNLDHRLKEMYNLKWCNECEKVDYFFGFIKCSICKKENCKQCVLLCKTCKQLYCKKCVQCPKCGDLSCLDCRVSCNSCSVSKGDKFCQNCITECLHCKRQTCQECIKQCISCKNMSCSDCSKFCRICNKSSCRRCESSKNFKVCYSCQQTSCVECVVTCTTCELEICKNCFLLCKRCKNLICNKCSEDCGMCKDAYCGTCCKEFSNNKCTLCKRIYCTGCVKNFRKCKVCKEAACKECHAQCNKCKNFFCNNCNLNCDNCNVYTCSSCVYKCVCDNLIFCEKCLLDVHPIGPHDCVLWMNDSPNFTGIKSRSKLSLPKNFEAKLYLEKFDTENLLVGLTDNNTFDEDSVSFVDNIWAFKVKTGQKYSSKNSLEPYYDRGSREKDFVIIAVKNDNLYFRVNFDENPPAFNLTPNREYYLYVENEGNSLKGIKVRFVYIRKI